VSRCRRFMLTRQLLQTEGLQRGKAAQKRAAQTARKHKRAVRHRQKRQAKLKVRIRAAVGAQVVICRTR